MGFDDRNSVPGFIESVDLRVFLYPQPNHKNSKAGRKAVRLGIGFDPGCYWLGSDKLMIYVPFGGGDKRDFVEGVDYEFRPRNNNEGFEWSIEEGLIVMRDSAS